MTKFKLRQKFRQWLGAASATTTYQDVEHLRHRLRAAEENLEALKTHSSLQAIYNQETRQFIKDKTEVNADIHMQSKPGSTIIVCGRYRNRDYVEVFTVPNDDFVGLIEQLKQMQKYARCRRIDAPFSMKAFIDTELGR